MTGNKKIMCKVCYREMRSDVLTRHMKHHSKRDEDNTVTNISLTNKYTTSSPSTQISEEENEFKDEEFRKALIKLENEYQKKIAQGQKIYKMLGEGVVSYQALTRDKKEEVDKLIVF